MAGHGDPGYFDGWQGWDWTCPQCAWAGTGDTLALEHFSDLFELHCPGCDHKFARVLTPSRAETQAAAKAGNPEAITLLAALDEVEVQRGEYQQSRRGRDRLPDLTGDSLEFTFDSKGGTDWMNPDWLVLSCGGREVHRERSGFEHWEAIIEVSQRVLDRYPGRVAWIDPSTAGDCLGGDKVGYDVTIKNFLIANGILPPTGSWAAPSGTDG